MNIPRSLTLPAVGLAIAATAFLVGRWSAPSAADGLSHFEQEGSPPIPAIAASNERVDIVEQVRVQTQQRIAHQWLRNDPAAARRWIQTTDLPLNVKNQLLQINPDG